MVRFFFLEAKVFYELLLGYSHVPLCYDLVHCESLFFLQFYFAVRLYPKALLSGIFVLGQAVQRISEKNKKTMLLALEKSSC